MKEQGRGRKCQGLFVADLDGTLLTAERRFAEQDLQALASLRRMGHLVAIATGRSNYSFWQLLGKLGHTGSAPPLPVDFVIFSTGAGIMDHPGNQLLTSLSLSPVEVRCAADYLTASGLDYMIHRPVPDTRHFLYWAGSVRKGDNPDFYRRLRMYGDFAAPFTLPALDDFGGATELLCIVPGERGHCLAAEIATALGQFSVIKATSPLDGNSIWIEIFAPAVSKSQAVKWLADRLGLGQGQVSAVGNDYNDEDLLHWAGRSFIVANGPPSLRALFSIVASNDHGGVSEAAALVLAAGPPDRRKLDLRS